MTKKEAKKEMKKPLALLLTICTMIAATPAALAAEVDVPVCYPTSVTQSEDGGEIRKHYDLSPEDDPAGIPRSKFEQDGIRYTLVELLKQELPEHESRVHTETVSVESKKKDMESVLSLLPAEREFITEDGLSGILTLQLETVQIEPAGYTSSTRELSATRVYPNLSGQDTQYIPKTIEEDGRTLSLQGIEWTSDSGNRYTATATYTGSATSSYVTGYTVTADYTGTVSRIALNKVRYVAIFEGAAVEPVTSTEPDTEPASFRWGYILIPLGLIAATGGGIGLALFLRHRREEEESEVGAQ